MLRPVSETIDSQRLTIFKCAKCKIFSRITDTLTKTRRSNAYRQRTAFIPFNNNQYFAGLFGLYCLKLICARIGSKVSSKDKQSSGTEQDMQPNLRTSKTFLMTAKQSCCHLFSRVILSDKERWVRKKMKQFRDIVALNVKVLNFCICT